MANQDSTKSGCFSGFLKVFSCAGKGNTPPVHPSDHITESDERELVHQKKEAMGKAATPGVVARLMGLDSLPSTRWVSKAATPDSVPRSRSVNFVDYLLQFDLSQPNHRRVKTSASFREVPALFQQQDHDLVVLYWGNNASKNHGKLRKSEMGLGELKQKKKQGSKNKEIARDRGAVKKENNQGKNKKISKLKNEPRRVPAKQSPRVITNHRGVKARDFGSVSPRSKNYSYRNGGAASSSSSSSPLPNRKKEDAVESKLERKIRNQESPKKIETEYCSENLSPVSVLEVDYFPFLNEARFSALSNSMIIEEDLSPLASKSKWKSSEQMCLGDAIQDRASNNEGSAASAYPEINKRTEYYSQLMLKILRLTENELEESDCRPKRAFDNESFQEICLVFELKIFDLLLHETVSELVQL